MNPFARGMVGHDDSEWRDLLKNKLQANLIDRGVESASVYSLYEYVSRDE